MLHLDYLTEKLSSFSMSNSNSNSTQTDFPSQYIEFEDEGESPTDELRKKLTFIGASAVSLLSYEKEEQLANILQSYPKYQLVKKKDIVSDVWSLTSITTGLNDLANEDAGPIIAWSVRLQVLYLGFRGSHCAKDIWTNMDLRQASAEELASRFHSGFLLRAKFYAALIRDLARKYQVVVCGHSLGGAIATIASYLAIAEDNDISSISNVWHTDELEESINLEKRELEADTSVSCRISTITFGAPAMMVLGPGASTSTPPKRFAKNFHHIINRDDIVPFIVNSGTRKATEAFHETSKILNVVWPDSLWIFPLLRVCFSAWAVNKCPLAHYGRLYLLDRVEGDSGQIRCHALITSRQIPPTPEIQLEYHSMAHYYHCLDKTLTDRKNFLDIDTSTVPNSTDFYRSCLVLPEEIEGCTGTIYPDKIVVLAPIGTPFIRFFMKAVGFEIERDGQRSQILVSQNTLTESGAAGNQNILAITHRMPPDSTGEDVLETADAMQHSLKLYDSFGRIIPLRVSEMSNPSLNVIGLSRTYESIRDAMIIAFTDQISMVQRLRRETGGDEIERILQSGILTENAKIVADIVDSIVANASPKLIKRNFAEASKLVEDIWRTSASTELTGTTEGGGGIAGFIFSDRPNELEEHLMGVLFPFEKARLTGSGRKKSISQALGWKSQAKEWEDMKTFAEAHPNLEGDTLAITLQNFGRELYLRDEDPNIRIEQAVTQSQRVLLIMKFCHAIILTQLDIPVELCVKWERELGDLVGAGIASGILSYGQAWAASIGWTYLGYAVGFYTGLTVFAMCVSLVFSFTQKHNHLQDGFDEMLRVTLQALDLPTSGSVLESGITDILDPGDILSHPRIQEAWRDRLSKGMAKLGTGQPPKSALNTKPILNRPVATLSWVKWLFEVGKIGQLRRLIVGRLYVGVEGPTEAGKSLLLTALTTTTQGTFNPGFGPRYRTTEIQLYTPPDLGTVFCDCPGSDDQDSRIRDMARLFRGLMDIMVFVIPYEGIRSERTITMYQEIVRFIKESNDPRPFRILLSKIDNIDYDDTEKDLEGKVMELKKEAIRQLNNLGGFPENKRFRTLLRLNGTIVKSSETLENIVYPYSTHAQLSKDGLKALSDCPDGVRRKVKDIDLHQNLYKLAKRDVIWDIESLRQWLRALAPNSLADSRGRVLQHA
ncbi:hypothetical protein TWF730_007002 [Orbilia blumenaviensis]|uniref:Fungal lipase-type domain-containing protein n=1 Tax=Orbilia blumenaviensis TaxID=1796055 RepID=A0AAV9VHE3_9PEZI